MPKRISVSDMFEDYAKKVLGTIPRTSVQFVESKKTFYAGIVATLHTLRDELGPGEVTEEEGAGAMMDMLKQIEKYYVSFL